MLLLPREDGTSLELFHLRSKTPMPVLWIKTSEVEFYLITKLLTTKMN